MILAGCVTTPPVERPSARAPIFPVLAFFTGESEGEGLLKVATRPAKPVAVHSRGRMEGDTLILDQRVREADAAPRDRQWRLREVAPGRFAGTLTDATGLVVATATPGRLTIAYRMDGGLAVRQTLTIAANGRSARNIMSISLGPARVGVLDETIRKLPRTESEK